MSDLQTIQQHTLIRNTVGYEVISKIDVLDLPQVLSFLKVVSNYSRMIKIDKLYMSINDEIGEVRERLSKI
jgi:hypothetical protein